MGQIYIIHFGDLEKVYVGSTINFKIRKSQHNSDLKNNKHHSKFLQTAFNQYGKNALHIEIFENNLDNQDLMPLEQAVFEYFSYKDSEKPYYNILKFAYSNYGRKHSAESKEKMSRIKQGKNNPMFGMIKENAPNYLKNFSEETKTKMSNSSKNTNKTHCKNGHEFTEENTRLWISKNKKIKRICRICHKARIKEYRN